MANFSDSKMLSYDFSDESPYESFMKRHLQHYGYYASKSEKALKKFDSWKHYNTLFGLSNENLEEEDYINIAFQDDDTEEKSDKPFNSNQVVYNVDEGKLITRLKEPRALFTINSETFSQQPRWPFELEVIKEKLSFLIDDKILLEPFYKPTGLESAPLIVGEETGSLIYRNEPILSPCFIKSRIGGSRNFTNCQDSSSHNERLIFESRFESGNLKKVYHVNNQSYELWLRTDLYTSKHTQWYFFRIENTRRAMTYTFTLVNFYKSASLYNEGLRPLMYSCKNANCKGIGWRRCGTNIRYFRSNKRYSTNCGDRWFYSLTFQVTTEHDNDTVYFAHCYPYTYNDLQEYLQKVQDDPVKSTYCKQRLLCRSLAGNPVYLLTISTPTNQQESHVTINQKRAIVVSARVHPGESNASWMMKGFLDYILSDTEDAKLLRDVFIFKVVPMLNPDGVIVGNYRCSLAGRDLNRNYKTLLKDSFPPVWHIKEMVAKLQKDRDVVLYCDLHGHSRRQNVFIYGCEDKDAKEKDRLKERVFPAMLSKNAPDKFCYESCKFKMQKSKEGTGRIVMYNLNVRNSFTMEASFCGSTLGSLKGYHFNSFHLEQLGAHLCDTLLDYFDPASIKYDMILDQVESKLKTEILVHMQQSGRVEQELDINELSLADISDEDMESSDGGSDSSVSDGLPAHYEFMKNQMSQQRKKKRRSKKDRTKDKTVVSSKPVNCPQNHGTTSDSAKRNRIRSTTGKTGQSDNNKSTGIRKVSSSSDVANVVKNGTAKQSLQASDVPGGLSDVSKVSLTNATDGSSTSSVDKPPILLTTTTTSTTQSSSTTDNNPSSSTFDDMCAKHLEFQETQPLPKKSAAAKHNDSTNVDSFSIQSATMTYNNLRLKSAIPVTSTTHSATVHRLKSAKETGNRRSWLTSSNNLSVAVGSPPIVTQYRSASAASDLNGAESQMKEYPTSVVDIRSNYQPPQRHPNGKLPYRRLHSASPSYSFPVQIAPGDQYQYQLELSQNHATSYTSDLKRSYMMYHGLITPDEETSQTISEDTGQIHRPNRPSSSHRYAQMYSEFGANYANNSEIEYDLQRRALIGRLASTNEALPPLGSYQPTKQSQSDTVPTAVVVDCVDLQAEMPSSFNNQSDNSPTHKVATRSRRPLPNQEIAQTILKPTVTYSSSNKPPVPVTTNQTKPATISLHITPVATAPSPQQPMPQKLISKIMERNNRKQKLNFRQPNSYGL